MSISAYNDRGPASRLQGSEAGPLLFMFQRLGPRTLPPQPRALGGFYA